MNLHILRKKCRYSASGMPMIIIAFQIDSFCYPFGFLFYRFFYSFIIIVTNINGIASNLGSVVTDGSVIVGNFISVATNINGMTGNLGSVVTDVSAVVGNFISVVTNIYGITGNFGSVSSDVIDVGIEVCNFITIVYNFNLFQKVKN